MVTRWTKLLLLLMGVAVALLLASDVALAQCAMCRTALLSSPEGKQMVSGFNQGILFLLCAPFVVVGAFAYSIFKACRGRAAKEVVLAQMRPVQ